MNRSKILISLMLVLLVFAMIPMFAACDNGGGGSEVTTTTPDVGSDVNPPEGDLELIKNSTSKYRIVKDSKCSSEVNAAVSAWQKTILDATGVELEVVTDFVMQGSPKFYIGAEEILIGETNREESSKAMENISLVDEYAIVQSGTKVAIVGGSDSAIIDALDEFMIKYFVEESKSLVVPMNEKYIFQKSYAITNFTINGVPISEFKIISPLASEADAENLRDAIMEKTGFELTVITSLKNTYDHEILLGLTGREKSSEYSNSLPKYKGGWSCIDGSLVFAKHADSSDSLVTPVVDDFIATVLSGENSTVEIANGDTEEIYIPKLYPGVNYADYEKTMLLSFAFKAGNPYMIFQDMRALYDCYNNKLVPVEQNGDLLVPYALVHEIIRIVPTVTYNGREYCSVKRIAELHDLNLLRHGDIYLITTATEISDDLKAYLDSAFPNVLPVQKPTSYDFDTLFNNDMTGTFTCKWQGRDEVVARNAYSLQTDILMEQVRETAEAGVDVQLLAALMGNVAIFKNRTYPLVEHNEWFEATYKKAGASSRGSAIINYQYTRTGDVFDEYIEECHKYGSLAFISMRMNDFHHLETVYTDNPAFDSITKFYYNNPQFKINPNSTGGVLSWEYEEVRMFMLNKIRDLCENYAIDGLELDFLRDPNYFTEKTSTAKRIEIMTDVVTRIRRILDNTAIDGQYRYLCVRASSDFEDNAKLGLDMELLSYESGVDIFVASGNYNCNSQGDIAQFREAIGPDKVLAPEITHCVVNSVAVNDGRYDNTTFLRATQEMLYTIAWNGFNEGANAVYAFNFQYYREYGAEADLRGPWNEPPFEIFENITDIEFLSKQVHNYYPTQDFYISNISITTAANANFSVKMYAPDGGYTEDGLLRFRFSGDVSNNVYTATFNGVTLSPSTEKGYIYETDIIAYTGEPDEYVSFVIPKELVKDGTNEYTIRMTNGTIGTLIFSDIQFE